MRGAHALSSEPCAATVLGVGVEWLVSRLVEAVEKAAKVLVDCPSDRREFCEVLLEALKELARGKRLAIFPALLVGEDGEAVDAIYENRSGGFVAVSPHILFDTGYAAHALLHELVHALGFRDDDLAEALAMYASEALDVPEPPEPVMRAEEKLRENNCVTKTSKPGETMLIWIKISSQY